MKQNFGIASKIWEIVYPVAMYYVAITIGIVIAQFIFGASNESYMLCKIIGSLVAIPVVYTDYKRDQMLTGVYGLKPEYSVKKLLHILLAVGIIMCLSISLNNIISMSPLVQLSEEYQNASDAFYGSTIWLELLGSALITPFLEELLHRGVVYGRLRRMCGKWSAVFLSALIFAILHFNIVQFIYAFLLGIVLALFVENSGRIYPAVIAHMAANGIAVIRTETGFLAGTVDGSLFAWGVSFALLIVGLCGTIALCIGKPYRTEEKK